VPAIWHLAKCIFKSKKLYRVSDRGHSTKSVNIARTGLLLHFPFHSLRAIVSSPQLPSRPHTMGHRRAPTSPLHAASSSLLSGHRSPPRLPNAAAPKPRRACPPRPHTIVLAPFVVMHHPRRAPRYKLILSSMLLNIVT
jgi:hypothetical protein